VCVCVRSEGEMGGAIDGGEGWQRRENASPKWQLGHAIRSVSESAEYDLAGLRMVWGVVCRAGAVAGASGLSFVGCAQVR